MIAVYQSKTIETDSTGDCFNACVASILEKPLSWCSEITPEVEGVWYHEWQKWLKQRGWELELVSVKHPPQGYSIVSVHTERRDKEGNPISHACVAFNGFLAHDPFPTGSILTKILYYHSLTRIA